MIHLCTQLNLFLLPSTKTCGGSQCDLCLLTIIATRFRLQIRTSKELSPGIISGLPWKAESKTAGLQFVVQDLAPDPAHRFGNDSNILSGSIFLRSLDILIFEHPTFSWSPNHSANDTLLVFDFAERKRFRRRTSGTYGRPSHSGLLTRRPPPICLA